MNQNLQADTTSPEYRRFLMNYTRERIAAKNYFDADFALQVSDSRFPADAVSCNLRAMLAYRLGLYEFGIYYAKKALKLDPNMKRAQENLAAIERASLSEQEMPKDSQEKYLLIHSWGSGFGFELMYLMQQLLIAELGDRTPVIYWGANSLYNNKPNQDCFSTYFEPISSLRIDDLQQHMPDVYPEYWQKRKLNDFVRRTRWRNKLNNQHYKIGGPYFFNRPERVVVGGEYSSVYMLHPWLTNHHRYSGVLVGDIYRDLMRRYIRPKQKFYDKANKFILKNFANDPFLAIHLRGTDKHNEKQSCEISNINDDLIAELKAVPGELPIFLMTDDSKHFEKMQADFGERLFSIDTSRSSDTNQGVHHSNKNKSKITEEVIVDVLVASRSSHFYGCGLSYLACIVSYMRASESSNTLKPFDVMTKFFDIPIQS